MLKKAKKTFRGNLQDGSVGDLGDAKLWRQVCEQRQRPIAMVVACRVLMEMRSREQGAELWVTWEVGPLSLSCQSGGADGGGGARGAAGYFSRCRRVMKVESFCDESRGFCRRVGLE